MSPCASSWTAPRCPRPASSTPARCSVRTSGADPRLLGEQGYAHRVRCLSEGAHRTVQIRTQSSDGTIDWYDFTADDVQLAPEGLSTSAVTEIRRRRQPRRAERRAHIHLTPLVEESVVTHADGLGAISAWPARPPGTRPELTDLFRGCVRELWACLDALVAASVEAFSVLHRPPTLERPRFFPVTDSPRRLPSVAGRVVHGRHPAPALGRPTPQPAGRPSIGVQDGCRCTTAAALL